MTLRYGSGGGLLQTIRDGGSSVDVDAAGNIYLAGFFVVPETASSVAKYDAAGARVWTAPLGASPDALSAPLVAADSTGTVTAAATVREQSTGNGDYLTIRFAADGRELWRYRFGGQADPGQQDEVAGLAIDGGGAALVTGTSWSGYVSIGGTATDIVTLKFPAGAAPALLAPSQLDATPLSSSQIRLRWQDNAGTEDGFRIERCAGLGCTGLHPGRRRGARRDELRRRRARAQQRVLVSRASVQRRRCLDLLQHGHGEDAAQVSDPIRHVVADVYRGVVSAVRRGPARRFRSA